MISVSEPLPEVVAAKAALRREARERRDRLHAAAGTAACAAAADLFLRSLRPPAGSAVALYWPIGSEFDCRPLMARLIEAGCRCALPVVAGRGAPLAFRTWTPETALLPRPFGLFEPGPDAPEVFPDIIVAACLAFDRAGYRLGYGAGYYDRTLAARQAGGARPVVSALLAYAGQEVARVPADAFDQPVDWIITEGFAIPSRTTS